MARPRVWIASAYALLVLAIVVAAVMTIEEVSQQLMPERRSFDRLDLAANLLGVLVFVAVGRVISASTRSRA